MVALICLLSEVRVQRGGLGLPQTELPQKDACWLAHREWSASPTISHGSSSASPLACLNRSAQSAHGQKASVAKLCESRVLVRLRLARAVLSHSAAESNGPQCGVGAVFPLMAAGKTQRGSAVVPQKDAYPSRRLEQKDSDFSIVIAYFAMTTTFLMLKLQPKFYFFHQLAYEISCPLTHSFRVVVVFYFIISM